MSAVAAAAGGAPEPRRWRMPFGPFLDNLANPRNNSPLEGSLTLDDVRRMYQDDRDAREAIKEACRVGGKDVRPYQEPPGAARVGAAAAGPLAGAAAAAASARPAPPPPPAPVVVPPPPKGPSLSDDEIEELIHSFYHPGPRQCAGLVEALAARGYRLKIADFLSGLSRKQIAMFERAGINLNSARDVHGRDGADLPRTPVVHCVSTVVTPQWINGGGVGFTDTDFKQILDRMRTKLDPSNEMRMGMDLQNAIESLGQKNAGKTKAAFLAALTERGKAKLAEIDPEELYNAPADAKGRLLRTNKVVVTRGGQRVTETTTYEKLSTGWRVGYGLAAFGCAIPLGLPYFSEDVRSLPTATRRGERVESVEYTALPAGAAEADLIDPELGYSRNALHRKWDGIANRNVLPFHSKTTLEVNRFYEIDGKVFLYTGESTIILKQENRLLNVSFTYKISDDKETSGKAMKENDLKKHIKVFLKGADYIISQARGHANFYYDSKKKEIYSSARPFDLNAPLNTSNLTKVNLTPQQWQYMLGSSKIAPDVRKKRHEDDEE